MALPVSLFYFFLYLASSGRGRVSGGGGSLGCCSQRQRSVGSKSLVWLPSTRLSRDHALAARPWAREGKGWRLG